MQCPIDDRLLIEYLEGELDRPASDPVVEHLEDCPECSARLKVFRSVRGAVEAGGEELQPPSADFWRQNLRQVERATWRNRRPVRSGLRRLIPAAAVAALLLLALVGVYRGGLFAPQQETDLAAVSSVDTVTTRALLDSLYKLAAVAEQYGLAYQTLEAIEALGGEIDGSAYGETGLTYPVTGSVYDAMLNMDDDQLDQVFYSLVSE